MYFLMACREEPPLSLRLFIALPTISEVRGCAGFVLGFFAEEALAFLGEACAGAELGAVAAAMSAMVLIVDCDPLNNGPIISNLNRQQSRRFFFMRPSKRSVPAGEQEGVAGKLRARPRDSGVLHDLVCTLFEEPLTTNLHVSGYPRMPERLGILGEAEWPLLRLAPRLHRLANSGLYSPLYQRSARVSDVLGPHLVAGNDVLRTPASPNLWLSAHPVRTFQVTPARRCGSSKVGLRVTHFRPRSRKSSRDRVLGSV